MTRTGEGRIGVTIVCTAFTLVAFALNSLFCRMALEEPAIDAASFTLLRIVAGAAMLLAISLVRRGGGATAGSGSWVSGGVLFVYAIAFSYAYLELSTGTGALILFGTVQATMVFAGLREGERPPGREWIGAGLALGGLAYLVSPGLTAPSPLGSALMTLAGIGWGIYSLRGRGTVDPIAATAGNFLRAVPFVLVLGAVALPHRVFTTPGAVLAVVSGAVTSGLGYVVWYVALRGLTATRAATVQLAVPVLAAGMGVVALQERISWRLAIAGLVVLVGVRLAIGPLANPPRRG